MSVERRMENGEVEEKTRHVLEQLQNPSYCRRPCQVLKLSRSKARIILIARYAMLDCAANYSHSYKSKEYEVFKVLDDENQRLNGCGQS